ncbi:MAG: DUF488 family protein [Pseudonocardiaceae bacterium]
MIDKPDVVGVGYQGLTIDQFIRSLEVMHVTCVVDVRLTPLSRKPGFSKASLARALMSHGISYEHARILGNPKDNRKGFAGNGEQLEAARLRYIRELDTTDAWSMLDELAARARTERIAFLCFEAETERCHRHVLLEELQDRHLLSYDVSA